MPPTIAGDDLDGDDTHAHTYWRVSGVGLAALAAVGILLVAVDDADLLGGAMTFDLAHNVLHVALAVLAIGLGFGHTPARLARNAAKAAGAAYVLLAVAGFLSADLFRAGALVGLGLEVGENALHLVLGAWGLYAGFRG